MQVSVIVTAISTSVRLRSLVNSLHRARSELPIYVGAQGELNPAADDIASRKNVHWVPLPYDCGLARARNILAREARTPFVLLCDDDFIFPPDFDLEASLGVFDQHEDLGVLGGRYVNVNFDITGNVISRAEPSALAYDLIYSRAAKVLLLNPAQELRGHQSVFCDYVWNFLIIRKQLVFERGILWDERFTIGGEHADFFLQLKNSAACRVAYFPALFAEHHHIANDVYNRLRSRSNQGQLALFEKYGLEYRIRVPERIFRLERGAIVGYSFDRWREVLGNAPEVFKIVQSVVAQHSGIGTA